MRMSNTRYPGLYYKHGIFSRVEDALAVEELLSIAVNDEPFTITMRSPGEEEALVRGLLFTEGICVDTDADPRFEVKERNEKGYVVQVNVLIPEEKLRKDFGNNRSILSVSSCGICGKTSLDGASPNRLDDQILLDPGLVEKMFDAMRSRQAAFDESGGTHAAGIFNREGHLLHISEDIGRHNAVDKAIGALLLQRKLGEAVCITVSGRISYEIVNKARAAGIPILASVSAPSGMAVEMAGEAGMTLLAFCRNDKLTVYTHPERIVMNNAEKIAS